jgi:ComEC/Rec2-related protein
MHGTVLWLATAAMVAGGLTLSRHAMAPTAVAAAIAVVWPLAVGLAIAGVIVARGRRSLFVGAILLLAFSRGAIAGDRSHAADLRNAGTFERSGAGVVRTFSIREASWPGPRCRALAVDGGDDEAVWLDLPSEACPLANGDVIAVVADRLRISRGPAWPGGVDPIEAAEARGAKRALEGERMWLRERGESGYWRAIADLRSALWHDSRGDDGRAFVVSSLFGVRAALSSERRRELGIAGLGHLIAVSGMQVSLVAWSIHRATMRALAPIVPSIGLAFGCSLVAVLAYVGLVGSEAPAVRAAIMVAAMGLAAIVGRPAHGLTVLAFTSVVMLMIRPCWILDIGFQLSFAAMAAILRMPPRAGLVLQSWRVGWAIMPVLVVHFGETGAWSVAANALAVPIFALWVTPLGIGAAVLDPIVAATLGDSATAMLWQPASWGASAILDVAHVFARAPRIGPWWVAGFAVLVFAIGSWRRPTWWSRWMPSRAVCLLVVAAAWLRGAPPTEPVAQWFAFGSSRTPTVVVAARDTGACVREPTGAPYMWPPLLDALGIRAVGTIAASKRSGDGDPPHVVALRDELRAVGRLGDAAACDEPSGRRIEAAMDRCAALGERPFAAVTGDEVRCFVAGAWTEPAELRERGTR